MFLNLRSKPFDRGDEYRRATVADHSVLVVCLAVFGLMGAQQMVNPLLAPLSRQLGISAVELGIVMAVGASGVVFASGFWARRALAWGHRTVLLVSLVGASVALGAFTVVVHSALTGGISTAVCFTLMVLTRGLVFGLAWAAAPVTAQSYVAGATEGASSRVRGMSMFGAAQGLGLAIGPAIGGILGGIDLLIPLFVAPVVLLIVAMATGLLMPKRRPIRAAATSVAVHARDRRVWPFLVAGFGLYLGFTTVLMTLGFLLSDRMSLASGQAGFATGLVTLVGAGMIVAVQVAVVPRLGLAPYRLIQIGAASMVVGMALVAIGTSFAVITLGVALLGVGLGFGMPGILTAPSLLVSPAEQSSLAKLISVTTGATFVIGPLLGDGLYQLNAAAPYLAGLLGLVGLTAFTLLHPAIRQGR
jgi:MFS family permease